MKRKNFFLILFCWLAFLLFSSVKIMASFDFDFDIPGLETLKNLNDDSWIFADANYSQATVNFSPGEMIFLKIETFNDGEQQRTVKLLNSQKETLSTFALQREGNNPFIFKQSFPAPNEEGIFYLHLDIKGDGGSVYVAESNINVGKTSGEVKSTAIAEANVNSSSECQPTTTVVAPQTETGRSLDETVTPYQTPFPTPTNHQTIKPQLLFNIFTNFFQDLITFFKNLFLNS